MWKMEQVRDRILAFKNAGSPDLVLEVGTKVLIYLL